METQSQLVVDKEKKTALVIDKKDNVAVALTDLKAGDECLVRDSKGNKIVRVNDDINFGHKFALETIKPDEPVYKYGEVIGQMNEQVEVGDWIHNHNMYCTRGLK